MLWLGQAVGRRARGTNCCLYLWQLFASCWEQRHQIEMRTKYSSHFPLWPLGCEPPAILSVFCYGSVQLYWILRDCNKFQDLHWKDLNWNEHSPVPKCDPDTVLEAVRPWLIDILTAAIERSWSETRDASDNRLTHCLNWLRPLLSLSLQNRMLHASIQILV